MHTAAKLVPLVLVAAGGRRADVEVLHTVPGTTLFDHLEHVSLERFPDSNVPDELVPLAREAFTTRSETIPPEAWTDAGEAPNRPGERLWKAPTRIRLDLGLGRPWVTHAGRTCTSFNYTPRHLARPGDVTGWRDEEAGLVIGFNRAEGGLAASGRERPGEVRIGWDLDDRHDGGALEPLLASGARPTGPGELLRTLEFDSVSRPVLVVGTPSRMVVHVDLSLVDELRLVVARWDVGFASRRGQLVRVPSPSDGMVFRVLVDGELLWSQAVGPANSYQEASIDLSAVRRPDVELAFETDPGPAGDARFDYGVWSGLGFRGEPRARPASPHKLTSGAIAGYHGRQPFERLSHWKEDSDEQVDRSAIEHERAQELTRRLEDYLAGLTRVSASVDAESDADERARLRALGYAGDD